VLDQLSAVAEEGAEGNEVGVRAEGLGQEAEGMEGLNPLTVEDIGLVAGREATGEVAADEAAVNPVLRGPRRGGSNRRRWIPWR